MKCPHDASRSSTMALTPQQKDTLLTLLPLLTERPPRCKTLFQFSPCDNFELPLGTATFVETPKTKPHPEIGGQRLTEEYVESLSEAECIWRFR
jgi:hypothetical protein